MISKLPGTTDVISERQWKSSQARNYDAVVKWTGGRRFRVEIKRDSHDYQSWCRGSIYANGQWNVLVMIPMVLCKSLEIKVYGEREEADDKPLFVTDATQVLKELSQITD